MSVERFVRAIRPRLENDGIQLLDVDYGTLPSGCDLVWQPGLMGGASPVHSPRGIPLIVTLHGVGRFAPVERRSEARRGRRWLVDLASRRGRWIKWFFQRNRSFVVVAVSNRGRQEIRRHLPMRGRRVEVIHHGVDPDEFFPEPVRLVDGPYLLHVSNGAPIKNVQRLVEAWQSAGLSGINLIIVTPDRPPLPVNVAGLRFVTERQSSTELRHLYSSAVGFVFPSLRETFGLPVLESMACGCPSVIGRGTACEEYASDVAVTVDPFSVDDIAAGIRRLAVDRSLRERLSEDGLKRASLYTWDAAARSYSRLFREVLDVAHEDV